jgi:hypothetical protein
VDTRISTFPSIAASITAPRLSERERWLIYALWCTHTTHTHTHTHPYSHNTHATHAGVSFVTKFLPRPPALQDIKRRHAICEPRETLSH